MGKCGHLMHRSCQEHFIRTEMMKHRDRKKIKCPKCSKPISQPNLTKECKKIISDIEEEEKQRKEEEERKKAEEEDEDEDEDYEPVVSQQFVSQFPSFSQPLPPLPQPPAQLFFPPTQPQYARRSAVCRSSTNCATVVRSATSRSGYDKGSRSKEKRNSYNN
eukprot:TRINITY_DN48611_c0_g1_i1.p2 TRINITY_DN48611_c0_g1~~TRINITY_DN48611_c0_g1_i1.p2  ORF type:complete len:162 (+),score=38.48 TRINITY_DN48611_c0_g1_i1:238-723(+)